MSHALYSGVTLKMIQKRLRLEYSHKCAREKTLVVVVETICIRGKFARKVTTASQSRGPSPERISSSFFTRFP